MQAQSGKELAGEERLLEGRERTGMQRVERGDEVSAIDSGDKRLGLERRAGVGVVPVVEMAAELLQPLDGRETLFGELDEFGRGEKAKLAGRLAGIEEQTDVGGRNARGFEAIASRRHCRG